MLGTDYHSVRKVFDITIFGNGGNISVKASQTDNVPELYLKDRTVYIKCVMTKSFSFVIIGNYHLELIGTEVPSGASRLEIGSY